MAKETKHSAHLLEINEGDFWDYCREVTSEIGGDNRRWVLDDMEAVRVSFDKKWTPKECAETIIERRQSLQI